MIESSEKSLKDVLCGKRFSMSYQYGPLALDRSGEFLGRVFLCDRWHWYVRTLLSGHRTWEYGFICESDIKTETIRWYEPAHPKARTQR